MPPAAPDVLVVAHRGCSAAHAEHTLGAYELALTEGADSLECDVRLTRDGVLVCVHDRRIDRVSDGRGVLSTLELADLADLDFASWKARQNDPLLESAWQEADQDPERRSVLTLERLLQLAQDSTTPSGRPVHLHIETKHPTRYGGQVERALVDLLERYGKARPDPPPSGASSSGASSPVTVLSYATSSLRRVHQLAPTLPTVLLMDRVPVRYRDGRLPPLVGGAGVALAVLKAHPRYVRRVQDHGGRVHVFTVDETDDIDLVLMLGVDAIISNEPGRVRRQLAARAP
jgi:glycerophosphoryl diester phosphodiesterase